MRERPGVSRQDDISGLKFKSWSSSRSDLDQDLRETALQSRQERTGGGETERERWWGIVFQSCIHTWTHTPLIHTIYSPLLCLSNTWQHKQIYWEFKLNCWNMCLLVKVTLCTFFTLKVQPPNHSDGTVFSMIWMVSLSQPPCPTLFLIIITALCDFSEREGSQPDMDVHFTMHICQEITVLLSHEFCL